MRKLYFIPGTLILFISVFFISCTEQSASVYADFSSVSEKIFLSEEPLFDSDSAFILKNTSESTEELTSDTEASYIEITWTENGEQKSFTDSFTEDTTTVEISGLEPGITTCFTVSVYVYGTLWSGKSEAVTLQAGNNYIPQITLTKTSEDEQNGGSGNTDGGDSSGDSGNTVDNAIVENSRASCYVGPGGVDEEAYGSDASSPFKTLNAAYKSLGETGTIIVTGDIEVSSLSSFSGKDITIKPYREDAVITVTDSSYFSVKSGTLTIQGSDDGECTLSLTQSEGISSTYFIEVEGTGILNLKSGCLIYGVTVTSALIELYSADSYFYLNGAELSSNTSTGDNLINLYRGTGNLNWGTISSNTVSPKSSSSGAMIYSGFYTSDSSSVKESTLGTESGENGYLKITENQVTGTSGKSCAVTLYNTKLIINGYTEITDNVNESSAASTAGIYVVNGSSYTSNLEIKSTETVTISGNKTGGSTGTESNFYFASGTSYTVNGTTTSVTSAGSSTSIW